MLRVTVTITRKARVGLTLLNIQQIAVDVFNYRAGGEVLNLDEVEVAIQEIGPFYHCPYDVLIVIEANCDPERKVSLLAGTCIARNRIVNRLPRELSCGLWLRLAPDQWFDLLAKD